MRLKSEHFVIFEHFARLGSKIAESFFSRFSRKGLMVVSVQVFNPWLEWAMNYTDPVEDSPCPEDTPSG